MKSIGGLEGFNDMLEEEYVRPPTPVKKAEEKKEVTIKEDKKMNRTASVDYGKRGRSGRNSSTGLAGASIKHRRSVSKVAVIEEIEPEWKGPEPDWDD